MFQPNGSQTGQRVIPQATDETEATTDQVGDPLGSFTGFLRRPKSSAQGLTAQFFGENGPDADVITALHLTRFLDATVKVTVWMIKNSDGRMMSKNNEFPKLAEFIATVKRPAANNFGQLAQFFGKNGPNADSINELNKTQYLDALVHVEIHKAEDGVTPADMPTGNPLDELQQAADRKTPSELQELKRLQRKAADAQKALTLGGFFLSDAVWRALGDEFAFKQWIETQPCNHPGDAPCDGHPISAFRIPGATGGYQFVPFCREHVAVWEQGMPDLKGQNPGSLLRSRRDHLVQRWAKDQLRRALKVPDGYDPSPATIYQWVDEHRLTNLLPPGFRALV